MIGSDGYLHILGRRKDLAITGGYNVHPKDVETVPDAALLAAGNCRIRCADEDSERRSWRSSCRCRTQGAISSGRQTGWPGRSRGTGPQRDSSSATRDRAAPWERRRRTICARPMAVFSRRGAIDQGRPVVGSSYRAALQRRCFACTRGRGPGVGPPLIVIRRRPAGRVSRRGTGHPFVAAPDVTLDREAAASVPRVS